MLLFLNCSDLLEEGEWWLQEVADQQEHVASCSPWDAEKTAWLSSCSAHSNCLHGFMFPRMRRYYLLCWNGSWSRWPACVACFLFSSHVGIKEDTAFEADILDLSMQNIAMLLFWWLASNLELAYPSEVYCNLSLMIGVPVIDGGLQAATRFHTLHPPTPWFSSPLCWRRNHNLWNVLWPSVQSGSTNITLSWNERD